MSHACDAAHANTTFVGYIQITTTWDWLIFVRKTVLLFSALLAGLLVGREGFEMVLQAILN